MRSHRKKELTKMNIEHCSSKTSGKIQKITKKSPVKKSQLNSILESPRNIKIVHKKPEVSLIDKLKVKKTRKRSVSDAQEISNSDSIESAMHGDEEVEAQEPPKKSLKRHYFS